MAFSLQQALEQIRSDKIKDRQQGIEAIDHIFADADNVRNLDPKHDGRAWLKTFQSLFACVLADKAACIRKGSLVEAQPAALARLQRSAQTLRMLVDKAAPLLTRKVVKALVVHILQMLNHRGAILQPIAAAYIAALCAIVRQPHHVDHLDPEDWSASVSLCFDILLGRELGSAVSLADAQEWLAAAPFAEELPVQRRGLSLEHAVTAECLGHLISSTVAPLLGDDNFGLVLLADYVRFLLVSPVESSAHLPVFTGLVVLLEHLELNHTSEVVLATLTLRQVLLNLWKTKNSLLKAQLLFLFRTVVSPVASCALARADATSPSQHTALSTLQPEAVLFLETIHDALLRDPDTRWALEPLHLDALSLQWPCHAARSLDNTAMRLSPTSTDKDQLAWCRLHLQLDLVDVLTVIESHLVDICNHAPSSEPAADDVRSNRAMSQPTNGRTSSNKRSRTASSSSPHKRSRIDLHQTREGSSEPPWLPRLVGMASYIDESEPTGPAARLCAVQLLTVLALDRPHLFTSASLEQLQKHLLALASDPDSITISWALLALASVALMQPHEVSQPQTSETSSRLTTASQAWSIAARKLQIPGTCRAAAYLLSVILAKSALPDSTLEPEISRLLADVDLQGPPMVCDSVCHLMALLMSRATSSRVFLHLDPRGKIGAWFSTTYSPAAALSSSGSTGPFLAYSDLLRLVDCLVADGDARSPSWFSNDSSFDSSPNLAIEQRRARLQSLRDLALHSSIAETSNPDGMMVSAPVSVGPWLNSPEALHRMTVVLDRNVHACLTALQDHIDPANATPTLTCHAAITAVHLAALALDVGTRSTPPSSSHRASQTRDCCHIILATLKVASHPESVRTGVYTLAIEQLSLLAADSGSLPHTTSASQLLVRPGPRSGIATHSQKGPLHHEPPSRATSVNGTSRRTWTAIRDANLLDRVLDSCAELFEGTIFGDEQAEPSSQAGASASDIFEDLPERSSSSPFRAPAVAGDDLDASTEIILRSTARLLLDVPRLVTGTADASRQELVVSAFFDCPVQGIVVLAPVLFDSFRDGTLWMSQRDVNDALDRLGTELLASYRFARQPRARLTTIRAVACVMPLLLRELDEQSDLFDKVQRLSTFFADQIGRAKWPTPWEVQLACAEFLAERLRLDPQGRLCRSGSARGPSASPVTALLKIHTDPDVRVRGLGSRIASSMFETFTGSETDLDELYSQFRDSLPSDSTQSRHILTRALSLCNAAIASSSVRRSSLFHLLEIVLATGMLSDTVQQLFAQVAARLGFPDAAACYQAFAGQITWGLATNGYDPLQLPWKVLGFASKRACLESTFSACGSMLLATQTAQGRTQFGTLVQLTRRSHQQGLQECLPFLTAAYIGFAAQAAQGLPADVVEICDWTLREMSSLGVAEGDDRAKLKEMMIQADDLTISTLLLLFFQPGPTLADSRRSIIQALSQLDVKCAERVEALTPTTDDGQVTYHEPSRPFFSAAVLYVALLALPSLGIEPFTAKTVYNVLRHIFHRISASRFVNDQLRMCAALRIYVAMCGDAFWKDALNNELLIRSIEQLLDQPQLLDEFQPLVVYACSRSCLAGKSPDILVSCIITWSQRLEDRLGVTVSGGWLLEAANALARSSPVATSAVGLLWPVALASAEQTAIESLIDIDTLAFALEACPRMSPQLPSLLRIRAVLARTSKTRLTAFCNGPAWKLLERVADASRPPSKQLGPDTAGDVISDIFATIVGVQEAPTLHREVRRLGGRWNAQTVESFLEAVDTSRIRSLSAATILIIQGLAHDLPIEQAYEAYESLRSMAAVLDEPLAEVHPAKMPAAWKEELGRVSSGISAPVSSIRTASAEDVLDPVLVDASTCSKRWLCRIGAVLCDLLGSMQHLALFRPVRRLVETNPDAARALFPVLLLCFTAEDAVQNPSGESSDSRRRSRGSASTSSELQVQGPAASCRAALAQHFEAVLRSSASDPVCSEIIVEALLALRAFRPVQEEPDNVCFWYPVDTSLLAGRCIAKGLLTAAIFFIEHGMQDAVRQTNAASVRSTTALLHQAYMNIDDPDAFYGLTDGDVRDSVLKRLHHEGQWLRAFQYHAADYEAGTTDAERRGTAATLGQSLGYLGFSRLVDRLGSNEASYAGSASVLHEAALSSSTTWDLPVSPRALPGKAAGVEAVLHTLRQASAEQDIDAPLSVAFRSKLQALCSTSVESAKTLRSLQGDLLALGQIRDWRRASVSMGAEEAVAHLRSPWSRVDASERFELTERVLDTRQSVLQAVRQRMQLDQIGDVLDGPAEEVAKVERTLLVASSRRAREHGKLQKAINAVARAQRIEDMLGDGAALAREEFAAVLWDQNEPSPAIQLLSQVIDGLGATSSSSTPQKRRSARLLALLAQWRATARSQQPREIDRSLFEPALKLTAGTASSSSSSETPAAPEQSEIAYRWAKFAEQQHRGSDLAEITRLRLYTDRRREEIAQNQRECERTSSKTERSKLLQFQRQAEKILLQDQTRLMELEASRMHFLRRSVAMYARALASSDEYDDAVPRLVSLWMENAADAELNRLMASCLPSIPSHKFVGLMHQLSARLTEVPDASDAMAAFQTNLSRLLLRMCQEHPFHCLYAIFALIKTGADAKAAAATTHRPSQRSGLAVPEGGASTSAPMSAPVLRSTAAEKIWTHIKRRSSLGKRIRTFEELCLAYVEWAEFELTSRADRYFQSSGAIKKGALRMPPSGELRLARLRDLDVPVATARLEIDATCRYERFVSIVRYGDTFTTAGGIHLPKISECIGSDGRRYKQLFKRDDDLRQDAVMQQVFRMVNGLLEADRRTRERHLALRTYTVLPLGPQCGLLEFVVNTRPLGEVLMALHARYRPEDMTPNQARAKLREAQALPAEAKLEAFLDVCQGMQPALRYFFSDAQRMPREWYAMRLRYTRSVSTNSMVGHVLGLGDRHVSNMLLDQASGELVHIDFGVAFDQGKLLPIPELVPFRLTRDVVDGMGVHGVEGTFRRCCEETLRVLRAHREVIKTVLEVFRHDPLFAWTSNPIKVLRAQEADESVGRGTPSLERSGSTAASGTVRTGGSRSATPMPAAGVVGVDTAELSADRAVSSVMSKLSSSLSVESTVNDLIQQAMDAGHLSAIFHGWQAAL